MSRLCETRTKYRKLPIMRSDFTATGNFERFPSNCASDREEYAKPDGRFCQPRKIRGPFLKKAVEHSNQPAKLGMLVSILRIGQTISGWDLDDVAKTNAAHKLKVCSGANPRRGFSPLYRSGWSVKYY